MNSEPVTLQARLDRLRASIWLRRLWQAIQLVVPLALFALLLSKIEIRQVWKILYSADWRWLVGGFLLFSSLDVWRTVRFRHFIGLEATLLFPVTILTSFFNTLLPFRLGEFSFPYFMRKWDVPVEESVTNLIGVRILDLSVLVVGTLLLWTFALDETQPLGLIIAVAVIGIGIALVFVMERTSLARVILNVLRRSRLATRISFPLRWREICQNIIGQLRQMASPSGILIGGGISFIIWAENCLVPLFLFRGLGLPLDALELIFAASLLQLIALLPFNVVGGIGFLDLTWVGLLVWFGMPFEQSSEAVIATRALFYLFVFVWGGCGWLLWYVIRALRGTKRAGLGKLP